MSQEFAATHRQNRVTMPATSRLTKQTEFRMRKLVILGMAAAVALCSGGAAAMGTKPSASSAPSYSSAEKAVKTQQYRKAIGILEKLVAKNPRNADAYNYLGYSHRELGEYDKAKGYYAKALDLYPNHRGANEYLGQLYLKTGDKAGAKAQLAKLAKICGSGCEEYDSLKSAIDKSGN